MANSESSVPSSKVLNERRRRTLDEQYFEQIDHAMLYIEQARERT